MRNVPSFLNIQDSVLERRAQVLMDTVASYQPLLGIWVIDIAVGLGWTHKAPGHNPARFFGSPEFAVTTGLRGLGRIFNRASLESEEDDDEDDFMAGLGLRRRAGPGMSNQLSARASRSSHGDGKDPESQELERRLLAHRATLVRRGVSANLPLFANIERLASLLLLNDTEKAILTFTTALSCIPCLNELLTTRRLAVTDDELFNVLNLVTGYEPRAVRQALRSDGVLLSSGLVDFDRDPEPLPGKLSLMRELRPAMLDDFSSDDELSQRVLKLSAPAALALSDFAHLQKDTELLQAYLQGAAQRKATSVNILLYGPPGTGKTEYAKALVASLGWRLYETDYADNDGDPISPSGRLKSMAFSQRALKHRDGVALLFDELEDVLPGGGGRGRGFNLMDILRGRSSGVQAKAWVNRMLEENPVPTIWITNDASIDDAYLRRFDYSLQLSIPPQAVRRRIVQRLVGPQMQDETVLNSLAALEDLLPAQVERAARVVEFAELANPQASWQAMAQTLARSRALLGQGKANLHLQHSVSYQLNYLNADTDLVALTNGLVQRGRGSLCLYGPAGTGKTAFGRYLADQLGCGLLVRRASDLMSKWVGESERNIAQAFAQAEQQGALLLIDEVDSFLRDRGQARAHWEVTLVNEMLTQMESFNGVFVASTNLMNNLDEASLRRFDLKVKFGFLKPDAAEMLLREQCCALGLQAPSEQDVRALAYLGNLTPGDFAALAKRHQFHPLANAGQLVAALQAETALKKAPGGRTIGFVQ